MCYKERQGNKNQLLVISLGVAYNGTDMISI
jgi:hypothetical protein